MSGTWNFTVYCPRCNKEVGIMKVTARPQVHTYMFSRNPFPYRVTDVYLDTVCLILFELELECGHRLRVACKVTSIAVE